MKKIMMGACALFALAAVSCGKCGDGKCETAANDSLSTAYGTYVGSMLYNDFNQFNGGDESGRQDFIKGLQLVFGANGDKNERMGMQVAIQMLAEMDQLGEQGMGIDKARALKAFKEAFLSDSLSMGEAQMNAARFRELYTAAQEAAKEAKEAEKAAAPEAIANGEAADKFVADLKANNAEAKTTDSGLTYVIEVPGEGDKPAETSTVVVNYTGKHLDGTVFDSSVERGEPATFNLQGVVPGFREGLMLLGKGGKATLYLPGKLAYGNNGQPGAGIGPNEMLVFEVELIDIK